MDTIGFDPSPNPLAVALSPSPTITEASSFVVVVDERMRRASDMVRRAETHWMDIIFCMDCGGTIMALFEVVEAGGFVGVVVGGGCETTGLIS